MTDQLDHVLMTFPPRPLTDGERQILRDWAEPADDLVAYVSERRSDDPALYRRIVISRRATRQRLYLVHCPNGADAWIVVSAIEGEDVGRFPTLRAALHHIKAARSHLADPAAQH
jgi:hypothetical protein